MDRWSASARIASWIPRRRLEQIETLVGLSLGKGWGAADVRQEVSLCLQLLGGDAQSGILAVDVGANVGSWSEAMLILSPMARVVAFEPGDSAAYLKKRLGHWTDAQVVEAAIGRHATTGLLLTPDGLPSHSEVVTLARNESTKGKIVDVVTLDSQAFRWDNSRVYVLKIDVEGAEMDVLLGAANVAQTAKVVQFEFGQGALSRRVLFRDFWEFFSAAGFRLWIQTPRGLAGIPKYTPRLEAFTCTNYFAQRTGRVRIPGPGRGSPQLVG